MAFFLHFGLISALVFVLIAVHEVGHYLAGLTAGIPARDMRVVLLAFPQHVALRDGELWVSPVKDITRYIEVSRKYFASRWAASIASAEPPRRNQLDPGRRRLG